MTQKCLSFVRLRLRASQGASRFLEGGADAAGLLSDLLPAASAPSSHRRRPAKRFGRAGERRLLLSLQPEASSRKPPFPALFPEGKNALLFMAAANGTLPSAGAAEEGGGSPAAVTAPAAAALPQPAEGTKKQKQKQATLRKELKLVVVGDGGCGKTSLLLVYARGAFPEVSE